MITCCGIPWTRLRDAQCHRICANCGRRLPADALPLIRELAQNYADGLLSAKTAMDAIAAAVL